MKHIEARLKELRAERDRIAPGRNSKTISRDRLRGIVIDDTEAEREGVWKSSVAMLPEWKAARKYPNALRDAQEFLIPAVESTGMKPSYVSLLRPPSPVGFIKDLHHFNQRDKP